MGANLFPLLTLFFTHLFLPFTSSHSLPHTTFLHVNSSLQQTIDILSFNFNPHKSIHQPPFTLQLHSRDFLHNTIPHTDYASLLRSRLHRDAARVISLNAKLQFAINKVNTSQLRPVYDSTIRPEDLTTPVTSGSNQGSGEYFTRIGVGTPANELYMVIDTGSDINWIQCEPCADCYHQTDSIFDPASSSSYNPLSCDSDQCSSLDTSGCRAGKCLYQVSYGDGSFTVGDFATETVSFGNSEGIKNVALGCGHDNEGLFVGAAGLVGLGGGSLSLTNQIKASSFSYCLVDRDSDRSSSLDFNSAPVSGSVTAPLMRNHKIDTFYYVGLTGFSVGGESVSIPPSLFQMDENGRGGVIVDCGTAITRLQTQAYNSLRDSFVRLTGNLKSRSGVALFDTCYDFSSLSTVKVPTLSFHFAGGGIYELPAKNYLVPVDSSGTFCFAFAPTSGYFSIIGNVQQQGTRVSFDMGNNRVGFSPNKC